MYTIHMKNWFHHEHIFGLHQVAAYLDRVIHNSKFWAVAIATAMIVFLLLLMIFAVISDAGNTAVSPFYYNGLLPYAVP